MLRVTVILVAAFGFLFGYAMGAISGALHILVGTLGLDAAGQGITSAAIPLGAVAGVALGAALVDRLGRRKTLILCAALFTIGFAASGLAPSMIVLVIARLSVGVAVGMSGVAAPMFLSEIAPDRSRGAIVATFQLMVGTGILASYLVDWQLEAAHAWRWMLGLGAIPAAVIFVGLLRVPESPRWLAKHGLVDDARRVISQMQPALSQDEAMAIALNIQRSAAGGRSRSPLSDLFSPKYRRFTVFAIAAFFLQALSGINAVLFYAPRIFSDAGLDQETVALAATVGIGIVNLAVTVIALLLVDRIGRRPLFIIGFVGTTLGMALATFSLWLGDAGAGLPTIAGLFIFVTFFAVSIGPLPWVYMSELFPVHLRGLGMALASGANWFINFLLLFLFPIAVQDFGDVFTFATFTVFCVLGLVVGILFAPETKGVSLEAIEGDHKAGSQSRGM